MKPLFFKIDRLFCRLYPGSGTALLAWGRQLGRGLMCLLLLTAQVASAQLPSAKEYALKTAFLYNFTQYIEWPSSAFTEAAAPLVVCMLDNEPFAEALLALQNKKYKDRSIVIRSPKTLNEARACHILYLDKPRQSFLGQPIGKALGNTPVLTVSSDEEAMDAGVGIGFVNHSGRLRWSLNLVAVRQAQLKASAKLIEIAVNVVGDTGR